MLASMTTLSRWSAMAWSRSSLLSSMMLLDKIIEIKSGSGYKSPTSPDIFSFF
jgi:hypothetical protein